MNSAQSLLQYALANAIAPVAGGNMASVVLTLSARTGLPFVTNINIGSGDGMLTARVGNDFTGDVASFSGNAEALVDQLMFEVAPALENVSGLEIVFGGAMFDKSQFVCAALASESDPTFRPASTAVVRLMQDAARQTVEAVFADPTPNPQRPDQMVPAPAFTQFSVTAQGKSFPIWINVYRTVGDDGQTNFSAITNDWFDPMVPTQPSFYSKGQTADEIVAAIMNFLCQEFVDANGVSVHLRLGDLQRCGNSADGQISDWAPFGE